MGLFLLLAQKAWNKGSGNFQRPIFEGLESRASIAVLAVNGGRVKVPLESTVTG